MRFKPLEQFICDSCGYVIQKIDDGWFEWFENEKKGLYGFRIVHASMTSPQYKIKGDCFYPEQSGLSDNHLRYFRGTDGLAWLLSYFMRNLADPKEIAEIIRRVHIPLFLPFFSYDLA
jgi:hypothetical protein